MGRVYLARTPTRHVVVKVIREHITHDPTFRRRFAREIDLARQVAGPYTAAVIDAGPHDDHPWLAIEYVPAPSLHEAVTHAGALPEDTLRVLTAGLAEALAAIHRVGIVHRDLKPANVLLAADAPRVIDFGIAKAVQENTVTPLTPTGGALGTPAYMSPEQILGRELTPAGDVFSLGGLLYFAATGRSPFGPNDPAVHFRILNITPEPAPLAAPLSGLVTACLEKTPGNRPTTQQILDTVGEIDLERATWLPPQVRDLAPESRSEVRHDVAPTARPTDSVPSRASAGTNAPQRRTRSDGSGEQNTLFAFLQTFLPRTRGSARGPAAPDERKVRRVGADDPSGAVAVCREVLSERLRVLGPDHPKTFTARHDLAYWQGRCGDAAGAARVFEEALYDRLRVLGRGHPDIRSTCQRLSYWRGEAGDAVGARGAFDEVLAESIRVLGSDHANTLALRSDLAWAARRHGSIAKATELLQGLLRDQERILGAGHPDTQASRRLLLAWQEDATERLVQADDP